jgi:hypothetical protein
MTRIPTRSPLAVRLINWWRYDLEHWVIPISIVALIWVIVIIALGFAA